MYSLVKNKTIPISIAVCFLAVGLTSCTMGNQLSVSENYVISSPDKRIDVQLSWAGHTSPTYSVRFDNKTVLLPSSINLTRKGGKQVEHDLVFISKETINETWSLPWGQFNQAKNHYNGVTFKLVEKSTQEVISHVEFRLFNDAIAYRYLFDSSDVSGNSVLLENSNFKMAEDTSSWSYNGMKPTKHIESLSNSSSQLLSIPAMLISEKSPVLAIQEASRFETAPIQLETVTDSSQINVVSEPINMLSPPSSTTWRVLQIGGTAGDLITSQALINLSPKSKIEDTSWIKAGKSFWDWRVRGEQYEDHTYALDNESLRRMINFAAANNMQYVMIDANWYGPEHKVESDPFTEIDGLNIKGLISQASEKGIGFILYLNDKASVNYDLDELFKTWSSWGAAGVKYGFMKLKSKDKVKKTLKIVELAAKHKLLINFHDGPVVPSGMRRTWPNWLTREAVHAQADGLHTFTPSGFIEMAHVNTLAGPLDMSNGFFKLNGLKESRNYVRTDVNSTVASEVARSLIIFSGLIIFPDSPEEYLRKKDLFEFLEVMPATWDESKILLSNIEQHIVSARRAGNDWFLGAAMNEQGGTVAINLDFLDAHKIYNAKIYADAEDTHYVNNREAYQVKEIKVKKGDDIKMKMAPGGGQAIWFSPINKGIN